MDYVWENAEENEADFGSFHKNENGIVYGQNILCDEFTSFAEDTADEYQDAVEEQTSQVEEESTPLPMPPPPKLTAPEGASTELKSLLSAWYTAGYYAGRYDSSQAKNRENEAKF